jgi:hypothetical protein
MNGNESFSCTPMWRHLSHKHRNVYFSWLRFFCSSDLLKHLKTRQSFLFLTMSTLKVFLSHMHTNTHSCTQPCRSYPSRACSFAQRCGPSDGPQCSACKRWQTNDEGAPVQSKTVGNPSFYCGRRLGRSAIPGSDGQCGPTNGPACMSCRRWGMGATGRTTVASTAGGTTAAIKVSVMGFR